MFSLTAGRCSPILLIMGTSKNRFEKGKWVECTECDESRLIIGILVLGAGIFYLHKEKNDKESRKIYTIISAIGGVIAVVCLLLLIS